MVELSLNTFLQETSRRQCNPRYQRVGCRGGAAGTILVDPSFAWGTLSSTIELFSLLFYTSQCGTNEAACESLPEMGGQNVSTKILMERLSTTINFRVRLMLHCCSGDSAQVFRLVSMITEMDLAKNSFELMRKLQNRRGGCNHWGDIIAHKLKSCRR